MDYSSWVNTCLDLNINPHRVHEQVNPIKEVESNFLSLGMRKAASVREEAGGALVEELKRVSAENKKLTEMLTDMCENYNTLRSSLMEYMMRKKRKCESSINGRSSESSSTDEDSCKKPKISTVCVKTEASDTSLIVKDGYQWRKYGQKVTRDNPSPRAYFKCSFAPSCPVKKKVQRSVDDQSLVVATYEGDHNHPQPSHMEPTSTRSPPNSKPAHESNNINPKMESPQVHQILVEQMATSLTKDPNFRAALVAAISARIILPNNSIN